jgi:hypothetical protein
MIQKSSPVRKLSSTADLTLPGQSKLEDKLIIEGSNLQPLNAGCDADLFGILCLLESSDEPALVVIPANPPASPR